MFHGRKNKQDTGKDDRSPVQELSGSPEKAVPGFPGLSGQAVQEFSGLIRSQLSGFENKKEVTDPDQIDLTESDYCTGYMDPKGSL